MKPKAHELYKPPGTWIPLKPGMAIKGNFPYHHADGTIGTDAHYWLILHDNGPESVDMVMSTTLACEKENKDRSFRYCAPNNNSYTEEIIFGSSYPLGADGRRVAICFDTGLTVPKEVIYEQQCIIAENGRMMDPTACKRIYKGVAEAMMDVNQGELYDPWETFDKDYRPESDFRPQKNPDTHKTEWTHQIQKTIAKAQMLQQNANPEIEYPR